MAETISRRDTEVCDGPSTTPAPAKGEADVRRVIVPTIFSAALAFTIAAAPPVSAQDRPFSEGKTITIVVGYSPAGGCGSIWTVAVIPAAS